MIGDAPVTQGEIVIDDAPVGAETAIASRRFVRYVGQHPIIFRGTILDNITLFDEIPTQAALEAAKFIGLEDEVMRMPLGYDTPLKNAMGRDLPIPTAQRVSLARALAMHPSVLLLDEANASLDFSGEQRFREALENLRGKTTIIMATHRPSLLKLADRIYEIRDGKLRARAPAPAETGRAAS